MNRVIALAAAVVSLGIFAWSATAAPIQHVLVSEALNDRVLEFDLGGNFIGVFASGFDPSGIRQGSDGNIYIADSTDQPGETGGGPVRKFNRNGTPLPHAFNGAADIRPDDLAFDSNGYLFFDNSFGAGSADDNIYRVNGPSSVTAVVNKGFNDPDDLTGTDTLDTPRGIAFDGSDKLLVTDRNNQRLLEFDSSTGNLLDVIMTAQNFIEAPLFDDSSIYYTVRSGSENLAALREFDGSVKNTWNRLPVADHLLLDSIMLPDGDLIVADFLADEMVRLDSGTGTFSTFASGSFDGTVMDGPTFAALVTIPEPSVLLLLLLGALSLLVCRRRR